MSSGHIQRRGPNSWRIKFDIDVDSNTGKRRTRYYTVKGTKRQAQAELTKLLASANAGTYVDPANTTVPEFLERWLRDWGSVNVSPSTLQRYAGIVHKQIIPQVGKIKIQKLQADKIAEMYATLLREGRCKKTEDASTSGLSPRTVGHVHRVLHRALDIAAKWGVVALNAADKVDAPKVEEEEVEIIQADALPGLLNALRGKMLYAIAVTGLGTGIRRGEMLALRWQDVDLTAGTMKIERTLEQTKVGGLRFKAPKSKRGRRTITLPAGVIAVLRARMKEQQEQWLALGRGRVLPNALVFATWDGSPRSPGALSTDWAEAMIKLGLPYTLHALRHTHASALIAGGMDVETLSRRLGHAKSSITLDVYSHLFKPADDRAVSIMDAVFSGGRTE
jgi:integrase